MIEMRLLVENWPLRAPVAITGYVFDEISLLTVILEDGKLFGRGEAYGVYYRGETAANMERELERLRAVIERGMTREMLQERMLAGGARNALDCALWELEAQRQGVPVWRLASLDSLHPVLTTRTIWGDTPENVAGHATALAGAPIIKLKLLGDGEDAARLHALRDAAPGAQLYVDANQGFDRSGFCALMGELIDNRVQLIEQPFPVGRESWLDGLDCPIPIAADESFQSLSDMAALVGRFQVVNIKLDKCGGLTEALLIEEEARSRGLRVMVGCMMATSLSMAPALIAAQRADFADVDGPLYLARDRRYAARYAQGRLQIPESLWGMSSEAWHRNPT